MPYAGNVMRFAVGNLIGDRTYQRNRRKVVRFAVPEIDLCLDVLEPKTPRAPVIAHVEGDAFPSGEYRFLLTDRSPDVRRFPASGLRREMCLPERVYRDSAVTL